MSIIDSLRWKRTLRTASSERLLALVGDRDAVAVDLHFLPDGSATGTVTVLDGSGIKAEEDRKSTRLNSSHTVLSRMPSSA